MTTRPPLAKLSVAAAPRFLTPMALCCRGEVFAFSRSFIAGERNRLRAMFLAGLRLEIEHTSAACVAAQPTKVSLLASVIQFGAGKVASAKTAWEELPAPVTPQLPRSGIGKSPEVVSS